MNEMKRELTEEELEIVREYREAKQPQKQIWISSQLHLKSKDEIKDILRAAGCRLPHQKTPTQRFTLANDAPKPETGLDAVAQQAFQAIRDALLMAREDGYKQGQEEALERIRKFLEGGGGR